MDRDRLTALYRRYGPAIYARCRALLADDADAEDATQETFLRVHRHLDRVPDAREALYWIYRVATNHCLNELRGRRGRALPAGDLPEPVVPSDWDETRILDRDLVRRLVARARPKVRSVAWLYFADGFDQDEVAAVLGLSRRTVAARLAHFQQNARKFVARSAA